MNIIHDLSIRESSEEISSEHSDNQLLTGKTVSYIEKKRKKNGEEYWTEIIITPIEFKGETAGLSINRDITERKIQEEKLLKALDAAKESDRIKTAFLANMSHELRTPLNAVIGFSDLIDDKTDPSDSADFARLIHSSGVNLLAIVDDIFEVTLIERGQININKHKKSVSIFLNDIYQTILHRQKNQGSSDVIIEKKLKGIDQYTDAFTDFTKLKQIFLSLLSNALKFTPEGFIRFGVYPSEDENELIFFVKDSGIGIPKEKHKIIFERFQIGDDTLTREYSGIGVGLYISKKLITILGGKIWLESELGKGSTFYFSIPR
jgi:signal transduction histidine kinase